MTDDGKNTIIDGLTDIQGQLVQLEAALYDKKQPQAAAKVGAKAKELTKTIEQLQSQVLTQWTHNQDEAVAAISQINGTLQACIDAINQSLKLADTVTNSLSTVDEIVSKAASFLKA